MPQIQVPFYSLNAGEVGKDALGRIDLEKMRMAAETMVNFIPTVLGPMEIRPGLNYLSSTNADAVSRVLPFIYNASTTSLLEISSAGMRVRNSDTLVSYVNHASTIVGGDFTGVSATYTRSATTVTITKSGHGLTNGTSIYVDFTTGGAQDGWYTVAGATANTFTVTTVATGTITTSNCIYHAGWTDASVSTLSGVTYDAAGAILGSTKYNQARLRQSVTVAGGDQAKLHCVQIVVASGPIVFRVGTTAGGFDIVSDQTLAEGNHFISFVPNNGTIYLEIEANETAEADKRVTSVDFFKNATLLVPTPWAQADLPNIRYAQSGSIIFIACKGYPPYQIERRGDNSWGVCKYLTSAGPYLNYSRKRVKLKASSKKGTVTITSDVAFFNANMVGSIFQVTHPAQKPSITFTGDDQYADPIRVIGSGKQDRQFSYTIGSNIGAGAGTLTLERAFGTPEGWTTVAGYGNSQSPSSGSIDDTITTAQGPTQFSVSSSGSVVYYRWAARTGASFAGNVAVSMSYEGGTTVGSFRIIGYTSATSVTAEIISPLGDTTYTSDWRQGAWSNDQSWPTSVCFHDGRLWWAGLDKVYGSVSDDFYNFDPETTGDSGPIIRSIATGPVEGINWMLSLQRLLVGTASAEVSIRSNSFDEPITPTAFTARNASTMGSSAVQAVTVDSNGIYVQRNGINVFLLSLTNGGDYGSDELTRLNRDICAPGVVSIAVQRQPDTRVWLIKSDGTAAVLVFNKDDGVVGWSRVVTDGLFEDVAVLPAGASDNVYFVVNRTINGVTKRYVEKLSTATNYERWLCDAAYNWTSGTATTAVTGLTHLAGKTVTVFSPNGSGFAVAPATYTVSVSGTFTLSLAQTNLIIGLPYTAQFKSVKLAYASEGGTALTQKKRVDHLGLLANDIVIDGMKIGRDFTTMTSLSTIYKGKALAAGTLISQWDYDATSFNGLWDSDSRLCIQCQSPYPATIAGVVVDMANNDRKARQPSGGGGGQQDQ